ncbi:MAG: T9SS type A sorting domain-containing protein, partial [Bacteroidota bacterium]
RILNDGCLALSDVSVNLSWGMDGTFVSANEAPNTTTDSALIWTDISLPVNGTFTNQVLLKMPDETRAGDELTFRLITEGSTAAGLSVTDTTYYQQTLRCAIDPNDKLVTPARSEPSNSNYTQIDERLTYTIRFQNTGNDTALNVRLEDQLSPELDLNSFKPLGASHDFRVDLTEGGRLQVFFDNIFLPDSNVNEVASHGFFAFEIDLKESALNTVVANTAGIYFDFNAPVITNTVENSIVEFLDEDRDGFFFWLECDDQNAFINPNAFDIGSNGIDEDCDGRDWTTSSQSPLPGTLEIFPNPTSGFLNFKYALPNELAVTLFDGRGRRMQKMLFSSNGSLNLTGLPSAIYFVRIMDISSGQYLTKRVIKR